MNPFWTYLIEHNITNFKIYFCLFQFFWFGFWYGYHNSLIGCFGAIDFNSLHYNYIIVKLQVLILNYSESCWDLLSIVQLCLYINSLIIHSNKSLENLNLKLILHNSFKPES